MNLINHKAQLFRDEDVRKKLEMMMMDRDFKLLVSLTLATISGDKNGTLCEGANAFVSRMLNMPFPDAAPTTPNIGLNYNRNE